MYESVKVAAISYRPAKWDKAVNADKMEELFVEAAREKPRMILITEGALEGYVVMEVVEGRASAEALIEVAEPIDGPYIRRFQKLARTLKTCLAFGFAERIGDEAFNCALFLDQEGAICGRYHKVQLAEGTHSSWELQSHWPKAARLRHPDRTCRLCHLQRPLESRHRSRPRPRRSPHHPDPLPMAARPKSRIKLFWPEQGKMAFPSSRPTSA